MERQAVKRLNLNAPKKTIEKSLLREYALSSVLQDLNIDPGEFWRLCAAKSSHNQLDTRERRHVYDNEAKAELQEQERLAKRREYEKRALDREATGYDPKTGVSRSVDREKEFLLLVCGGEKLREVSSRTPGYIRFKSLKCGELYVSDIPLLQVEEGMDLLIVPKKTTVLFPPKGSKPIFPSFPTKTSILLS